jgi:DNA polymerase-3 subunit epsilon
MDRSTTRDRDLSRRWAESLLARSDWAILDTETTGLDSQAEAIQVAIVGPDGSTLLDTLVRPLRRIPYDAMAIHGITDAMVADAPAFGDVYPRLAELLTGKLVIAYNAAFDRRIIRQTALLNRLPDIPVRWECAMEQYSRYVGQWSGRRGGYTWVSLPRPDALRGRKHQAIDDCLATLQVIRRMAGSRALV